MSNLVVKFIVLVEFPDGSEKRFFAHSNGEAKRKRSQALGNVAVQRLGGVVSVLDPDGKVVEL